MRNIARRITILRRKDSKVVGQEFLVLKDSASDEDSKVIREAEKIVEKFMGKKEEKKKVEKKVKTTAMLWLCVLSFSLGMIVIKFFT